ncbi:MAG: hypothetical protein JSW47_15555 [Phycisphaerales bacterium]|nr:MAG: hypothetical protein JSW47_15555 [Phycisphaerales bacterium]UCF16150.1 MAG: hypothetical protein JSW59_01560 [Phycisphaerales bacterium]
MTIIKMDPKSIVIGALAAVIVFMAMGAARRGDESPRNGNSSDSFKDKLSSLEQRLFQKLAAPRPGRFQVDVTEKWAVVVDTATGEAWKHSLLSGPTGLCPPKLKPAGN